MSHLPRRCQIDRYYTPYCLKKEFTVPDYSLLQNRLSSIMLRFIFAECIYHLEPITSQIYIVRALILDFHHNELVIGFDFAILLVLTSLRCSIKIINLVQLGFKTWKYISFVGASYLKKYLVMSADYDP